MLLVPGIVFANAYRSFSFAQVMSNSFDVKCTNLIPLISKLQNSNISFVVRIWSLIGHCKFARAKRRFTVLPIPSHEDLPWLVVKKFHVQLIPKSVL